MRAHGLFIVFEGGEGSGKSTQAQLLADALGADLTREPGGTPIGERIREILLDEAIANLDDRAELMLILAARAQHVSERIRPALELGRVVVCDRFTGSTLAYQCYGRGLDRSLVEAADALSRDGIEPDVVVLLDLDPEKSASRRIRYPDRIEREDGTFFERVRAGYQALAASDPEHWVVVDASGTPSEVHGKVLAAIDVRLQRARKGISA